MSKTVGTTAKPKTVATKKTTAVKTKMPAKKAAPKKTAVKKPAMSKAPDQKEIEVTCQEVCETAPKKEDGKTKRHLFLMRHGKASKEFDAYKDIDRPLIKRGKKDLKMVRKMFASLHVQPDIILCSPSARTEQTLDIIKKVFDDTETVFMEELYLATASELLRIIQNLPHGKKEVLIIGHNPGLAEFAEVICNDVASDELAYHRLGKKFPTSAVAFFELTRTWKTISDNSADLIGFVRPTDLK